MTPPEQTSVLYAPTAPTQRPGILANQVTILTSIFHVEQIMESRLLSPGRFVLAKGMISPKHLTNKEAIVNIKAIISSENLKLFVPIVTAVGYSSQFLQRLQF